MPVVDLKKLITDAGDLRQSVSDFKAYKEILA